MRIGVTALVLSLGCGKAAPAPPSPGSVTPPVAAPAAPTPVPPPAPPPPGPWSSSAAPLGPAGPTVDLTAALALITRDDIPEGAIDKLFAWVDARGSLPWRGDHASGDLVMPKLHAMKLGEAALARRPGDPRTAPAVLYLAQRIRAEGGCEIDAMVGFRLAATVRAAAPAAARAHPELAATEAELRRAPALAALCARWSIDHDWAELASWQDQARRELIGDARHHKAASSGRAIADEKARALDALVAFGQVAPADLRQLGPELAAISKTYEDSWLALFLLSDVLINNLDPMQAELAAASAP